MLPSTKDIFETKPPYLLEHPAGDWSLVIEILNVDKGLKLTSLFLKNNKFLQRDIIIDEPPFYVGADVWELEYGTILMTLDHPTLSEHPAKTMWNKWKITLRQDNS